MAKKDTYLKQTGAEVQALLDIIPSKQNYYYCSLAEVESPREGDICVVPSHIEEYDLSGITEENRAVRLYSRSKNVFWETNAGTLNMFSISYSAGSGMAYVSSFPSGSMVGSSLYRGTVSLAGSDGSFLFGCSNYNNMQYLESLSEMVPDIAYIYHNGTWYEYVVVTPDDKAAWNGIDAELDKKQTVFSRYSPAPENPKEGDIWTYQTFTMQGMVDVYKVYHNGEWIDIILVSDEEKAAWSAKYDKPGPGIPASDIADAAFATREDILALFTTPPTPSEGNIIEGTSLVLDDQNSVSNHNVLFVDSTTISNNNIILA